MYCEVLCGKEEKDERKTEGGIEIMMSCPDFEHGTPRTQTSGPVDASH